ncbi:putative translation initiation factor IF-2 [Cutibacterium acnes HL099PA1]|nr:putative translation initiation factor IF-2 [Cutibacterium acnes HL099PA1]
MSLVMSLYLRSLMKGPVRGLNVRRRRVMPSIGDAGGLDKGVEKAGMVGNLVEPPPRGQFGVTAERAHTSAEGRPSQNGGVPHRQQGSGMHPDQGGGYGIGFTAAGGDPGANVRG